MENDYHKIKYCRTEFDNPKIDTMENYQRERKRKLPEERGESKKGKSKRTNKEELPDDWPTMKSFKEVVEKSRQDPNCRELNFLVERCMQSLSIPREVTHVPIKLLTSDEVKAGQMQETLKRNKKAARKNGAVLMVIPGDGPTIKKEAYKDKVKLTVSHKKLGQIDGKRLLTTIENIKTTKETLKEFSSSKGGAIQTNFLTAIEKGEIESCAIENEDILEDKDKHYHWDGWNLDTENGLVNSTESIMNGINKSTRYHSSANSFFPAHQEDGRFPSVNVALHDCQRSDDEKLPCKVLFVAQSDTSYLELMRKQKEEMEECDVFWKHKIHFPDIQKLIDEGIQVRCVLQFPGSIFFSTGIHWGFNTGTNHNIAVNVATERLDLINSQLLPNCGGIDRCKIGEKLWDKAGNEVKDEHGQTVMIGNRTQRIKVKKSSLTDVHCHEPGCGAQTSCDWTNSEARRQHYKAHHNGTPNQGFKKEKCLICKGDKSDIWKHYDTEHHLSDTANMCMLCREVIPKNLEEHYSKKHGDKKCTGCKRQFEDLDTAQNHQCGDGAGVFKCPACKNEFQADEDPQGHQCVRM